MHFISFLKTTKIYIKIQFETAPTCFGLRPSSGSLDLSLAKISFIKTVGKTTSLWTMRWCSSMLYQVHDGLCALCVAQNIQSTRTLPWTLYNMLPHHRITHNDVFLPTVFINEILSRLKCKFGDDGSRPKHVGALE